MIRREHIAVSHAERQLAEFEEGVGLKLAMRHPVDAAESQGEHNCDREEQSILMLNPNCEGAFVGALERVERTSNATGTATLAQMKSHEICTRVSSWSLMLRYGDLRQDWSRRSRGAPISGGMAKVGFVGGPARRSGLDGSDPGIRDPHGLSLATAPQRRPMRCCPACTGRETPQGEGLSADGNFQAPH
jgi:hypothetical protein